jgi:UDP-glucuronate 4-epimerase
MAPMLFANAITKKIPIEIFNYGEMFRDFTYIDDIVEGVLRVLDKPATRDVTFDSSNPSPASSNAPYRIFNIGSHRPVLLMDFIKTLESNLGMVAIKKFLPIQPGDVISTAADTSALKAWVDFQPTIEISEGVPKFIQWYLSYHKNDSI